MKKALCILFCVVFCFCFVACNNENKEKTITALPMSEGMTQSKYGVTLIFESGAEKYRQHRGKFPVDTTYIANIE